MKRAIKERHELLTPCELSPTGEHRVWLDCDAEKNVVRLVSECRQDGAAALRLGAKTCLQVVLAARHEIATKAVTGSAHTRPHGEVPEGIAWNVHSAAYPAADTRKKRARPAPDTRPLLVRALERRARLLSPEFASFPLTAFVAVDETRNLRWPAQPWTANAFDDNRGGYVVAQKRHGRWTVEPAYIHSAKHAGKGEGGRCLICRGVETYTDFQAHGRAQRHQDGVRAVLQRVVEGLP